MRIALIITSLSMFIFMLLPFRQQKSRWFYYFLTLAIEDPVAFILTKLFSLQPMLIHVEFAILLFVSVNFQKDIKKKALIMLPFLIASSFVFALLPKPALCTIIAFIHIIILLSIIKIAFIFLRDSHGINIFQIVLVFYESTIVTKLISYVLDYTYGVYFFHFTTAIEILIGVFFLFFRESNRTLIYIIKEKDFE